MTADELLQLACEEADQVLEPFRNIVLSNEDLTVVIRDAVARGMLIGSRIALASAESELLMMKAKK